MPRSKGIKVRVGKTVVGRKIKYHDVAIPMFNVITVNPSNFECQIVAMTGEVMLYNDTGRFKVSRDFYERKILDKELFHEKIGKVFIKV